MRIEREKLAWAAGLFEGEGTVFVQFAKWGDVKYPTPRLCVTQSGSTDVLTRFNAAVAGLCTLLGPLHRGPRWKPRWDVKAQGIEKVQAIMSLLWPWLGPVKRDQYRKVMGTIVEHRDTYRPTRPRGARGHNPGCQCKAHRNVKLKRKG